MLAKDSWCLREARMDRHGKPVLENQMDTILTVLNLVRSDAAHSRPEIVHLSGLGRNVVTHRVSQLLESGLLVEGQLGPSTGGRAPRELLFRPDTGYILVAELGATSISVAISDLTGQLTGQHTESADVTAGPEVVLARVEELFDELLQAHPVTVWGVGVGLPGPVEFSTGRPVAPPIMPGWDRYDARGYFENRYDVPVWVDNDANVMALGELRSGLARGQSDVVYVKVGYGIGAGLVSGGEMHRGAQGSAGDIGHIEVSDHSDVVCRCGQKGCLEALAGGIALAREGQRAADTRQSPFLAELRHGKQITAADVGWAALNGDPVSVKLITHSAVLVGETLARLVNFYNPALILIGGGVADVGDLYLATIRQAILRRSLPLATRALRIERSPLGNTAGLTGAGFMVIDQLLTPERLGMWIERGTPAGQPALSA